MSSQKITKREKFGNGFVPRSRPSFAAPSTALRNATLAAQRETPNSILQECEARFHSKLALFFPSEILPRSRDLRDIASGLGPLRAVEWDVKLLRKLRAMTIYTGSISDFQKRAIEHVVMAIAKRCAKRQQQMPNFAALDMDRYPYMTDKDVAEANEYFPHNQAEHEQNWREFGDVLRPMFAKNRHRREMKEPEEAMDNVTVDNSFDVNVLIHALPAIVEEGAETSDAAEATSS
ncbi:hypothetical protein Slin15195_G065380 [Septoria linicola]|uniref:Uncharacterized protein n=1 Tax=Septoria linicola TaxID=215465 RepID=A0A9Q9EKF9_9PEZI|nr:hypothetical protein Slin14017_G115720 [Septoria linicola]USW53219.1 hypothetical protein Slin15195_G065380 [Septoria linicola]